ncbi:hypothetical protein MPH_13447, partial [Macrophomina phaseolina MS6]
FFFFLKTSTTSRVVVS